MLTVYYILVFGMLLLFAGSVVWALWWAIHRGQFSNFARGATSIFDDDEPVGEMTDAFPDRKAAVNRLNRERGRNGH